MLYLKEPDSYSMSESRAACVPNSCMRKVWKARLIQGEASVAVAHSAGYGAPVQFALSGAMVAMSALVRGAMLQGGTGVALQKVTASEKMTNSALSLMMVGFANPGKMKLMSVEVDGQNTIEISESCISKRRAATKVSKRTRTSKILQELHSDSESENRHPANHPS
jgi:hypothetical protein